MCERASVHDPQADTRLGIFCHRTLQSRAIFCSFSSVYLRKLSLVSGLRLVCLFGQLKKVSHISGTFPEQRFVVLGSMGPLAARRLVWHMGQW